MNKKGNRTTTGYIPWEEFQRLIDTTTDHRVKLFAAISAYGALRASDVLALRWKQLSGESIVLVEKKTKKNRTIAINEKLKEVLSSVETPKTGYVFASKKGKPISLSYVNRVLKKEFDKMNIQYEGNISSHMFRKTFGRRFLNISEDKGGAMIMLMEVLNHTSLEVTKRYLGIKQEEINQVYLNL